MMKNASQRFSKLLAWELEQKTDTVVSRLASRCFAQTTASERNACRMELARPALLTKQRVQNAFRQSGFATTQNIGPKMFLLKKFRRCKARGVRVAKFSEAKKEKKFFSPPPEEKFLNHDKCELYGRFGLSFRYHWFAMTN